MQKIFPLFLLISFIWKMPVANAQWQHISSLNINDSTTAFSSYYLNTNIGFLYAKGKIFRTSNASLNHDLVYDNDSVNIFTVTFKSPLVGFAGGRLRLNPTTTNAIMLKTVDGGLTWQKNNFGYAQKVVNAMDFYDENLGMAVCDNGYVLVTNNGGIFWTRTLIAVVNPSFSALQVNVSPMGSTITAKLWSFDSRVYHSANSGLTWQEVQPVLVIPGMLYASRMSMSFNSNVGYISAQHYILKTTNYGASWQQLPHIEGVVSDEAGYDAIAFYSDSAGYMSAGYIDANNNNVSGLYKTTNGGLTWEYHANTWMSSLWAVSPTFTYGTYRRNVYKNSTGQSGVTSIASKKHNSLSLLLSPNPCRETLQISQNQELLTDYQITDLAGRSVSTWQSTALAQAIKVADLPVGMYVLRATNTKGTGTYKFVKE